jgi:hypothetical protein
MPKEPSLNSSMPWVKLWVEFPDDPKIGQCSEGAQLLFVKLLAIAGDCDAEGYLVNGDSPLLARDIAWRLRMDAERTCGLIAELVQYELLEDDEGYLLIPNFSKRQGRSQMQKREKWAERQRRRRERIAATVTGDSVNVTGDNHNSHADVTLPEGEGEGEKRREEGEDESAAASGGQRTSISLSAPGRLPTTPKEAMLHPDIRVFREASGRIPGLKEYELVIQTVQLLRQKIPEEKALVAYLGPFWVAWSGRKTKNGRPYDASSLVWLTEWAVNDHIPASNGSEPQAPKEYTAAAKKKAAREEYERQMAALEAHGNANTNHLAS